MGVGSIYTEVTIHLLFGPLIRLLEIHPTETPEKARDNVGVRASIVALFESQTSKQLTRPAVGISSTSHGTSHSGVQYSHKKGVRTTCAVIWRVYRDIFLDEMGNI